MGDLYALRNGRADIIFIGPLVVLVAVTPDIRGCICPLLLAARKPGRSLPA
jgi:hypothetical protein